MWDVDQHVSFSYPFVKQHRNAHNYRGDFAAEHDLYQKADEIVNFMLAWDSSAESMAARLEDLIINMYEYEFIGIDDVVLVQGWLKDLMAVGFDFPIITEKYKTKKVGLGAKIVDGRAGGGNSKGRVAIIVSGQPRTLLMDKDTDPDYPETFDPQMNIDREKYNIPVKQMPSIAESFHSNLFATFEEHGFDVFMSIATLGMSFYYILIYIPIYIYLYSRT
jgi:hypothetical protein